MLKLTQRRPRASKRGIRTERELSDDVDSGIFASKPACIDLRSITTVLERFRIVRLKSVSKSKHLDIELGG